MKRIFIAISALICVSAFSQTQQISVGYGFNNANQEEFTPFTWVEKTNFIGAVNYHYILKSNFEIRGSIAYSNYNTYSTFTDGRIEDRGEVQALSLNAGSMYHYFTNSHLDFSSGFSVGLRYRWVNHSSETSGKYTGDNVEGVYAINLLNIKYFPFDEHFGVCGEVILDNAYHSNYYLGLVYQF